MSRTSPGGKTSGAGGKMSVVNAVGKQDGTENQLPPGVNRVCYSYLTSVASNQPQIISLDKNFIQPVFPNNLGTNAYRNGTDGYGRHEGWGAAVISTISPVTSNSNSGSYGYPGATHNNGEFGNSAYDYFSNHTYTSPLIVAETKHPLSFQFVDSDHTDRNIVYCYSNSTGAFFAIDRITRLPIIGLTDAVNVKNMGVVNSSTFGDGSFSYNAVRKELVGLGVTSINALSVKVFSNVDFNKYPSPATALTREEVTVKEYTVPLVDNNWINAAGAFHVKPVLVDNGEIYFIRFRSASVIEIFKLTLNYQGVTGTATSVNAVTTSNVVVVNSNGSAKKMQSRDGSTVCTFGQYYYYSAGAVIWIIDKRKNSVINALAGEANGNTSIVPFGDSGWLYVFGNTSTTGNPNGMNGSLRCYERIGTDGVIAEIPSRFRPKLPWHANNGSNTDYPIISQVADYSVLTGQGFPKI